MLRDFWKVKEVKETRNIEVANQLLASDTENWRLFDVFQRDGEIWYALTRYGD